MRVIGFLVLLLLSLAPLDAVSRAENLLDRFHKRSVTYCAISTRLVSDQTRSCSCKSCNNAECCIGDGGAICKDDCSTYTWSISADEKCSDSADASLCCSTPSD